MFTIRNLVEQYTNQKAIVLKESYSEVINETSLCIIFKTLNGTEIFIDMHPEMEYTKEDGFKYQRPNNRNVFRKFDFEIISGDNIILTKGIDFKPWTLNNYLKYQLGKPITEKQFNEFILDNGGIDTEDLTKNINRMWSETSIN